MAFYGHQSREDVFEGDKCFYSVVGLGFGSSFLQVIEHDAVMFPRPSFFQGARLNFAENLLYPICEVDENTPAVIAVTEQSREVVSWRELRIRVRQCATAMHAMGVKESDRVAGYMANQTNAVIAMLAAVTLGAIWTGVSPDTGAHAVLERLGQIEPVVLFADSAVIYNGKIHVVLDKIEAVVEGLPGLKALVIFNSSFIHSFRKNDLKVTNGRVWAYEDFIDNSGQEPEVDFAQLHPDHPIYILYSSGTTGSEYDMTHASVADQITKCLYQSRSALSMELSALSFSIRRSTTFIVTLDLETGSSIILPVLG